LIRSLRKRARKSILCRTEPQGSTFPAKVFIGGAIKSAVRNGAGAFYAEFALQTRLFTALSQLTFAKARLKTFSKADAFCKSFYRRAYAEN